MFDLDDTQQRAWELYLSKKNVGIFGRAGCGKSTVMLRAINHARRVHGDKNVGVMAWTNSAASRIGGQTVHKFLGVGLAQLPKERVFDIVSGNAATRYRIKSARVIFIDELPMMAARWFRVLEHVMRKHATRCKQALPWGGCQVIVGGDPLQLGPVLDEATRLEPPVYLCREFRDTFLSRYGALVFLSGCHRQSSASWFVSCLDRIRTGDATDTDLMLLNATSDGVTPEVWNGHTQLRARNVDVDHFNAMQLARLEGPESVYNSRDEVNKDISHPNRVSYIKRLLQSCAPEAVSLKPGAVVLTTRVIDGVPTGTQGIVVECQEKLILCSFMDNRVSVSLASFDAVDNCGVLLGTRYAVPLVLAWAMTIHRAQGTNLSTLAVDFTDLRWCKEGLVYAGLSRCRMMEGLLVRGLRRKHIVASQDALKFYSL